MPEQRTDEEKIEALARWLDAQFGGPQIGNQVRAISARLAEVKAEAEQLREAVGRVRELHVATRCVTVGGTDWMCQECRRPPQRYDETTFPCPTLHALDRKDGS